MNKIRYEAAQFEFVDEDATESHSQQLSSCIQNSSTGEDEQPIQIHGHDPQEQVQNLESFVHTPNSWPSQEAMGNESKETRDAVAHAK